MEYNFLFWFLAILASIFVGLGKGGLPVIAMLSVPILSLVMPTIAAASLLLPVYILSDVFAFVAYRRDFDKNVLKIGIFGITVGVILGWMTAHVVIDWMVTLFIGLIGFSFSITLLTKTTAEQKGHSSLNYKKGFFWCSIAGFTSFISHNGGPPWQIFTMPLGMSKTAFVGTSVVVFSYCNIIKLVPYYFLGQISLDSLKITLYLAGPASIAVLIGAKLVKVVPEGLFFKIITYALLIVSCKLMWDGMEKGWNF